MAESESNALFKLPQLIKQSTPPLPEATPNPEVATEQSQEKNTVDKTVLETRTGKELDYAAPPGWGPGDPPKLGSGDHYFLEELKNGVIVAKHQLTDKSFFSVGRLQGVDIKLEHPSLSRHHAVIQYKAVGTEKQPRGFYAYDLGSTHGTYHNKQR